MIGLAGFGLVGVRGPKIKVAQNGLKHVLVLEFLRCEEIFEISCVSLTSKHASIHTDRPTYLQTP